MFSEGILALLEIPMDEIFGCGIGGGGGFEIISALEALTF